MKITDLKLYTIKSGDTGARGAAMARPNSLYPEYLLVGKGDASQPIFAVLEGEPLPINGKVTLDPNKSGFGVELKRELLAPFKG